MNASAKIPITRRYKANYIDKKFRAKITFQNHPKNKNIIFDIPTTSLQLDQKTTLVPMEIRENCTPAEVHHISMH